MKPLTWIPVLMCLVVAAVAKTDPATEKDLMAAMDALKQATINKDVGLMSKITHPDITYTHSSGLTQDKKVLLEAVPKMNTASIEFLNTTVRVQGNVALVQNTTDIRGPGATTPTLLNALYVWVKGSEGWQLLARQPIRLQDPNAKGKAAPAAKGDAKQK